MTDMKVARTFRYDGSASFGISADVSFIECQACVVHLI